MPTPKETVVTPESAPDAPQLLWNTDLSTTPPGTPAAPTAPSGTPATAQLNLPTAKDEPWFNRIIDALQVGINPLTSPRLQQGFLAAAAGRVEQRRRQRAAEQGIAIQTLFLNALQSGDPQKVAEVSTQLSKLKGLEPEAVSVLEKGQLQMADDLLKVSQTRNAAAQAQQERAALAKAIQSAAPNSPAAKLIGVLLQSGDGAKFNEIVGLMKSGVYGTPPSAPKVVANVGIVSTPGTGLFYEPGTGIKIDPLPPSLQKLSDTGFSGMGNVASEYVLSEAARRGISPVEAMTKSDIVSGAAQAAQAEREKNRQYREQMLVLSQERYGVPDTATVRELRSTRNMVDGVETMGQAYQAALASHGGSFPADVVAALSVASTAPEGVIGKSLNALAQRYPKLNQLDLKFVSEYASMQQFARGALNDVGNLSTFERSVFTQMLGAPFDRPDLFKTRVSTVLERGRKAERQIIDQLQTQGRRVPQGIAPQTDDSWIKEYGFTPNAKK